MHRDLCTTNPASTMNFHKLVSFCCLSAIAMFGFAPSMPEAQSQVIIMCSRQISRVVVYIVYTQHLSHILVPRPACLYHFVVDRTSPSMQVQSSPLLIVLIVLLLPLMGTSILVLRVYLRPYRIILLFGRLISMVVTTFPKSLYLIDGNTRLIVLMDSYWKY